MSEPPVIKSKNFPSTRYQGSKRKILPWIYDCLKDIKFDTVLDGFGGTGAVSYLFKKMGKEVYYNDKLKFNHIIGKALIENSLTQLNQLEVNNLLTTSNNVHNLKIVETHFDNIYFLNEENVQIDTIVSNILNMPKDTNGSDYKQSIAFYSLFQTTLIKRPFNLFHRKNLNIRLADVKRNFGNKVTWDKSIEYFMTKFTHEANNHIFDNKRICKSLNKNIYDVDPYGFDMVYLDPPYISNTGTNESSNYLKCYHFLEGLAKYSEWYNEIDFNTSNLRLQNVDLMDDFIPKKIKANLENLIDQFKDSTIVLSYKLGGVPSIEELEKIIGKVKRNVYTISLHYKYALNRQNGNAALNREVLIIGV